MSEAPTIPVIGMTLAARTDSPQARTQADRTAGQYRDALLHHGASVIELRPPAGPRPLEGLDGVLLTGGGDVNPRRYGQAPHPKTQQPDDDLDELELSVCAAALACDVPILGICRGAQVLGVALGGQLLQDVNSEIPMPCEHLRDKSGSIARHWVQLAPGSHLAEVIGAKRIRVNSFHHQANSHLGAGVVRAAWCEDGVTEAIEAPQARFAIGVQWHPERMWRRSPRQRRLFAAFVAACRAHRHRE